MRRRRRAALLRDDQLVPARRAAAAGREEAHIAMGYAVAAMIVAGLLLLAFASNAGITQTFFTASAWRQSFPQMIRAFWTNIWVALVAQVLVLLFGLLLAVMRMLPGRAGAPLRLIALVYCDIFRAVPAIVTILLIVFGLPLALPTTAHWQTAWLGVIALTLTYSAYVAEVYRAGLSSIHPSQSAAARSLGLSHAQTLRTVLIPQAVRRVIPPLLNDFISLQKDTALLFAAGILEVLGTASLWESKLFNLAPVTLAAFVLHRHHHPAGALHRLPHRARRPTARTTLMPFLEIKDVHKAYGLHEVLKGVSLNVERHEVVCLIGASGSGKSTLLRCVNALEEISAGEICIDGDTVSGAGVDLNVLRRDVGIVFQSYNLFPHMSVLENITLAPTRVGQQSKKDARERAMMLLESVNMAEKARAYPDALSGGQQQRVAIVRALAMQPRVLLLDEITAALDPELVGEVLEIVRQLAEAGLTMLLATHEMGFARDVASQVCFLDAGCILERGRPQDIFENPREPRTQQFLSRVVQAGRL